MAFQGGVLIIGSLLWDGDNGRTQWRAQRLNENNAKAVAAPIRYGRFSRDRKTYTMVFSRLCYRHKELGQGVVVPFARSIGTFDDLRSEVEHLDAAEGMDGNWEWGAVGLFEEFCVNVPCKFSRTMDRIFQRKIDSVSGFCRSDSQ
jgi:hypothetical protein